ncbi:MAG: stress response translation initiation inhibitor YciH [Candidatus Aenigmarchaeota archaeon]|nr:stress response translation initiation inhibitor YciH [Candidatus Aenigmarchaeota archaeon]
MAVCPKCGSQATANTCSKCGLPFDLCVCVTIEREAEKIRISTEMRRFNKPITVIEGIDENAKDVSKQLKSKLACGGTVKEGHIELQGDHKTKAKDILVKLGYSEEQIEIS